MKLALAIFRLAVMLYSMAFTLAAVSETVDVSSPLQGDQGPR